MHMDVEGIDYDSDIDGSQGQVTTEVEESSDEEEMKQSFNNNALVEELETEQKGDSNQDESEVAMDEETETMQDQLWDEFRRLKTLMEKKGMLSGSDESKADEQMKKEKLRMQDMNKKKEKAKRKYPEEGKELTFNCGGSESTIYQRAVKHGSSSSEDNLINTSDELEVGMEAGVFEVDSEVNFVVGKRLEKPVNRCEGKSMRCEEEIQPGCSYQMDEQAALAWKYKDDIDARLDKVIMEAEASRA